jgi:hypothetical protein
MLVWFNCLRGGDANQNIYLWELDGMLHCGVYHRVNRQTCLDKYVGCPIKGDF